MKTLYLECAMGASGDMLMGALTSLLDTPLAFVDAMNNLGLPGVKVSMEPSVKCGITGTHMSVTVNGEEEESLDAHHEHAHPHHHNHGHEHAHTHHHGHSGMHEIGHIIDDLPVSQGVKDNALAVYALIAQAESEAHGKPVNEIHFHEVGTMDAIADIVGVSMLMERLAPEQIIASPVNTGFGHVHCAHGILPVPAPATASILRGVPAYAGHIEGELCTPTGAALLKHFVTEFRAMPIMAADKIGYGMGKKDFAMANCLRAFLGETQGDLPRIAELKCNLDDMTPEAIGYATNVLLDSGALDVFTTPIYMKKNRPGVLLTCLCGEADAEKFARLILKHTTTIGLRKTIQQRYTMVSHQEPVETPFGTVPMKHAKGYGVTKCKPEYENAAQIAKDADLPLTQVLTQIMGSNK